MKGIIFTEYVDFVTDQFGVAVCEEMLDACSLTDDGAYTAVGTYEHTELVAMVVALSNIVRQPVPALVRAYGEHLFGVLAKRYPAFVENAKDTLVLLTRIEDEIHVEVRKLYPDAELPSFTHTRLDEKTLEMHYHSERGLADVAEGLIRGCARWYGQEIQIDRYDLSDGANTHVRFVLEIAS